MSRMDGGASDSSMDEMVVRADEMSRLVEEPSENESGVALNMAMMRGVVRASRRRGVRVGTMGTSDWVWRESRTEMGRFSVGWMNVGKILLMSDVSSEGPQPSSRNTVQRLTR
jgi:hypothetical protein